MSRTQRHAKSITQPKVGVSATLSNLLGGRGTGASSSTPSSQAPVRPRATLVLLAISLVALFATAAPATAALAA